MARILVIDDEAMLASTLSGVLERAGHEVDFVSNGRAGLDQLIASPDYDLVVTDLIMPQLDGLGLIQSLRTASPNLKIVAISGGGRTKNFDLLRLAHKLGANSVLRKPFSTAAILSAVTDSLAQENGITPPPAAHAAPTSGCGE